MRCLRNRFRDPTGAAARDPVLDRAGFERARDSIGSWPGYAPTPLRELPGLAARLGIGRLEYKDESGRFGLGSFKALGGAYAVYRHLEATLAEDLGIRGVESLDLMRGAHADAARRVTVATATDGNHGRSVAWGASRFGCSAVVYLPRGVSGARRSAIETFGARVVDVPGDYDAAVRACARESAERGHRVVTDTSYEGETGLPREVMQGYRILVEEWLGQRPPGTPPTHVFVQGGVGSLAAAVAVHLTEAMRGRTPRIVVVEPESADCLFRSAELGRPARASGDLRTVMGGLACGECSLLAWEILRETAGDFVAIPDEPALEAMRMLAAGLGGDPPLVAGESGAAGVAALLAAAADAPSFRSLGLGRESSVLVFGTEGATDPAFWERVVGRPPGRIA